MNLYVVRVHVVVVLYIYKAIYDNYCFPDKQSITSRRNKWTKKALTLHSREEEKKKRREKLTHQVTASLHTQVEQR